MRVVGFNANVVRDFPLQASVDVDQGVVDEVVARADVGPTEVTEACADVISGVARNSRSGRRGRSITTKRLVIRNDRIEVDIKVVIDLILG